MLGLALGFAAAFGIIARQAMRNRRMRRELAAANAAMHENGPQALSDDT